MSDETVDTSVADDTGVTSEESAVEETPVAETPAVAKYKYRRRGEERELTGAELAQRYDDEYEHEFRGPKGAPVKKRWSEIERSVQKSEGAENAIRAAQEERKALGQSREWGKKNVADYLQRYLGVQDPEAWALDIARKRFEQETTINDLMLGNRERGIAPDPYRAQEMLRELERNKLTRAQTWAQQEAEGRAAEEKRTANVRELNQRVANELQKVGIKPTPHNMARAAAIHRENRELEIDLTFDQVAAELKKTLRAELLASLDEEQDLIGLLGEKRRAKIRELEIAATKAAKKAAAPAAKPAPAPAARPSAKPKTINDFQVGKW